MSLSSVRWVRKVLDARPRDFGYTVVEYDLVTGRWVRKEIKVEETRMRIEVEGQQYEANGSRGWELIPEPIFKELLIVFNDIRSKNKYSGEVP